MTARLSSKEAREMGLPVPVPKQKYVAVPDGPSARDAMFRSLCHANGVPEPVSEHKFDPSRKWRLDYFWWYGVALEIQGGIWTAGRHVRGKALLAEHEKLNAAACAGIRVLFCTPADVESGAIFPTIKAALERCNDG